MQIVRSVVIDCHIEDVFEYVADPLNDREWRPARMGALTCVEREPPHRVAWRWEAEGEMVDVSFALEPVWTSTRLTMSQQHPRQRAWMPRRALAARDLDRRLEALRRRLERR